MKKQRNRSTSGARGVQTRGPSGAKLIRKAAEGRLTRAALGASPEVRNASGVPPIVADAFRDRLYSSNKYLYAKN